MKLREWDPAVANESELEAWLGNFNLGLHADLPDDPAWGMEKLREYLVVTMPGERRVTWLAEDGDDLLGYARLLMIDGLGVIELNVAPAARRRGVGKALLGTLADRAIAEGFTSLGVEVVGGTAAASFYTALGFTHVYTETRSILSLSTMDWDHVGEMAEGIGHGYQIEFHARDLPEEILASYAEAKQVRRLDPNGDLELRPSSYDPDRLRTSLRCLDDRGLKVYIVVAMHERTETVAGLTELVVPDQHPARADQYDTTIVPEHNGYGLARAIKARMLLEMRTAEPQLGDVQTWHAPDREQLQQINKELGFLPDREWREYETDARDLAVRLR